MTTEFISENVTRTVYDINQLKWIAQQLVLNGFNTGNILECMDCPEMGFPKPHKNATFQDAIFWAKCIDKVIRVCRLRYSEFNESWDDELVEAYNRSKI